MHTAVLFFMSLIFLGLGAYMIFMKDSAWEQAARRYRRMGLEPQRTAEWEAASTTQGVVVIVIGIVFMCLGLATTSAVQQNPAAVRMYTTDPTTGKQVPIDPDSPEGQSLLQAMHQQGK